MPDWRVIDSLESVSTAEWQTLQTGDNPFLSRAFLYGLEKFGCLANQQWQSAHILLEENNTLLGLMPLYIKQDSYGEFVFDWAWADAYHRAGHAYYPKLVSAIPFTPVSGPRLLIAEHADIDTCRARLVEAVRTLIEENRLSSAHVLFPDEDEMQTYTEHQAMSRLTIQFHWLNDGYRDFSDFTDRMTSKKRKKLLRERRDVISAGVEIERLTGSDITEAHWQVFHDFYCTTFYKKWGEPRMNLDFFLWLGETIPDQTLLILAKQNNRYIAGAFAMHDRDTLYGRHWGCNTEVPFLHFELCYYQTIEHVLESGLLKLDAGVQGEHKLARGFSPVGMSSAHWIREQAFSQAIKDYLKRETGMVREHIAMLETHLPYKQTG